MKAVIIDDKIHALLKDIAKTRSDRGDYCKRYKDIVADMVIKAHRKECE